MKPRKSNPTPTRRIKGERIRGLDSSGPAGPAISIITGEIFNPDDPATMTRKEALRKINRWKPINHKAAPHESERRFDIIERAYQRKDQT